MAADNAAAPGLTDVLFFRTEMVQANWRTRIGVIRPDGSGECYPDFALPDEIHLVLGYVSPDGRQAELNSPASGKNWRYDVTTKAVQEIAKPHGESLPGGTRFLHNENANSIWTLYTTDVDGGNREVLYFGPGYAYGVALSPDGLKVAYHITNVPERPGYEIYVIDLASKERRLIVSDTAYLHFAPAWSPDSTWLLYQRCAHTQDPGHDRSDLCLSRADGSAHRQLTTGQAHWFAAAYGTPERHSSGSNLPVWSPDGRRIACALLLPDSRTAWPFQANRPDTDHFNRDYHPELAQGGTQISLIEPQTGVVTPLSHDEPPTWNLRLTWSPDGSRLAFVRAKVGCMSELWVMDADGRNPRLLTRGLNGTGVDHPRWVRLAVPQL